MEPQVELSPEGAGAMSADADADADAGLAAQDAAAVDTRSAAETSAKCCSVRGEALWNMAMWATYFNLFCCLPRLIILPGMFINIVRGPLYGFFVHPLWALVYCSCTLVLVMCKDDPQADALIDPFQFVAWLTNRVGGSTALHRVRDCVSVGRRRAAVLNMVWIFVDWVLTALTFGISLGFLLLVFTEWDGEVTSGFNAEYAVIVVGIVFCGMSLLSEIVIFASLGLFVCSTCCQPTSPTDSTPDSAEAGRPEAGRPEAGEAAVEKSHGLDQAPDAIKAMNGLSVYFICAVSIASCVLLSFCIHDSLRGQYYHHDTDADYGTCDGLVPIRCALPFPSSFWLEAGHSTGTGYKVNLGTKSLPYTWRGEHMEPEIMNRFDGFSISAPILWHLDGVQSQDMVSFEYVDRSQLLNSTTMVVRAKDVYLHPHFSEIDRLDENSDTRIMYSVPATALDFNTTYVVIVQRLTGTNGELLQSSKLWNTYKTAYSTGDTTDVVADERYTRFLSVVFPVIDALNLSLSEVQLAWDFHTASFDSISDKLISVVDMATTRTRQEIDDHGGLPYELVRMDKDDCSSESISSNQMSSIAYYRVNVPWFLINMDRLGNDIDSNLLSLIGEEDIRQNVPIKGSVGLLVQVPCSLTRGLIKNVSSIVEFGHGLFGNRGIATDDWLQKSANTHGWIVWSADWRGFSTVDVLGLWRLSTHDVSEYKSVEAALVQSFASKTALRLILPHLLQKEGCELGLCHIESLATSDSRVQTAEMSHHFRAEPILKSSRILSQKVNADAIRLIDSTYIGHSLGAIIGASWSISTGYVRSVHLAGGSPFSFIVGRSAAFSLMKLAFDLQFYRRADTRIALSAWQCGLDIFESSGWKFSDRLYNISILSINVLGDTTVSGLSSQILAANINASLLEPTVTPLYLVPGKESPIIGTNSKVMFQAISEKDHAKIAKNSEIPAGNDVHNCLLQVDEIIDIHNQYITEGFSTNPCGPDSCVFPGYMHCG